MLNRWTRISLVVLGLVAIVVSAHHLGDAAASRQLENALARLDAAARDGGPEKIDSADVPSPVVDGLVRAIESCRVALGPERFDLMTRVDDADDPTSLADLRTIVNDSSAAFAELDAALAHGGGRLPRTQDYGKLEYVDLMHLACLCAADVTVRLDASEFDAAAASVRRISALADAFEDGPGLIQPLIRFNIIEQACRTARPLLEQAPHPAALLDLAPKTPDGALHTAWAGEALQLHDALAAFSQSDLDLAALTGDPIEWPAGPLGSAPFVEPWIKSGLVELTEYVLEARNHLPPTSENVTRLRSLEDSVRTEGHRLIRDLVPGWSNLVERELTAIAGIDVLRAGATAWAHFRERGVWPNPESFGADVVAKLVDDDLELRSALVPTVTWILIAPRQSEEARDR